MKIFNGFLIILGAVLLLLLPLTDSVYAFQTDAREDEFTVTTGVGVTTANVTLIKNLYQDDTGTISLLSSISETPTQSSWNATTNTLTVGGLTSEESRTLTVDYDTAALSLSDAEGNIVTRVPFLWLLMIIGFPVAAIAAIFMNRA